MQLFTLAGPLSRASVAELSVARKNASLTDVLTH